MDMSMLYALLALVAIVVLYSLFVSVFLIRKQQQKERDQSMNEATAKHPVLLNTGFIAYVLFPLLIVIGAYWLFIYLY